MPPTLLQYFKLLCRQCSVRLNYGRIAYVQCAGAVQLERGGALVAYIGRRCTVKLDVHLVVEVTRYSSSRPVDRGCVGCVPPK